MARNTSLTDDLDADGIELHIDDSLIDYDDPYSEDWDDFALEDGAIVPHPLGAMAFLHELPF